MLRFTRETIGITSTIPLVRTKLYLDNNSFVGQCFASLHDSVGYIKYLSVDVKYRKMGYGSLLLTETERWIPMWYEISKFQLQACSTDPLERGNIEEFYLKNGWERVSRLDPNISIEHPPWLRIMEKKCLCLL